MGFETLIEKVKSSKLFKDSFWAVFGNGLGNALLLCAGILIARLLGKDLYGEYGVVKTTMFHIAAFSTFGLGYTSTKFIAQHISENTAHIVPIAKAAMRITIVSSLGLCALLLVFADKLAVFVENPQLATSFRYLGLIVVCRAISTTASGIVSGFKDFKRQGRNNIISGLVMLVLAPILTFFYGLKGSLLSLLVSQLLLCVLNLDLVRALLKNQKSSEESFVKALLVFSFPVAMQELTYALSHWGGPLLLAKYASLGEVGLYSAAGQWNAIIRFIPGLLSSLVLSYLSSATQSQEHKRMMGKVLSINFICALIPFIVVLIFSGLIVRLYGNSFEGLRPVLNILIFSTVFSVIARVFQNEFISRGKNWLTFAYRSGKDVIVILSLFLVLKATSGINAAISFALIDVIVNIVYTVLLAVTYMISSNKNSISLT